MSKQIEALKLALEALDCIYSPLHVREINKVGAAMSAIREALADHIVDANKMIEQPAHQIDPETRTKDGLKYSPNYVAGYNDGLKAAQQQEPVAITRMQRGQEILNWNRSQTEPPITVTRELWVADQLEQFYTSPPASKPWVGLTTEERKRAIQFNNAHEALAVVIEAKLKEKNA